MFVYYLYFLFFLYYLYDCQKFCQSIFISLSPLSMMSLLSRQPLFVVKGFIVLQNSLFVTIPLFVILENYCFIYFFRRDLSREFGIPISLFSSSAHEFYFQKEFFEGNLPFIAPNTIISWVRSVSTNIYNW